MKQLNTSLKAFRLCLLLGLLFGFIGAQAQLKGDTFAQAKAKGSANVTFTYVETPGFAMKEGGQMTGFCVELMKEFAKWLQAEEGIELKPVFHHQDAQDFAGFMQTVKASSGGVFGLGNITITEERKNSYDFSPPFISNIAILMTHKSVANLNSLEEMAVAFNGMTMVTAKGSLNEKRLLAMKEAYFPTVQVMYLPSNGEVLQEVGRNEKAFTDLDFTYYLQGLKQRMPVKRHPVGDETSEDFGIIMPNNNDWSPLMTRFMKSGFMESTEYRKMIADHLGQHALRLLDAVSVK